MSEELNGKNWAFYWAEGWKIHLCPKWLIEDIKKDLEERDGKPVATAELRGIDEIWWDPGGMAMVDRSYQKLNIDGAELSVASIDFPLFVKKLEKLPLRMFTSGRAYYKLHGWPCHCLVLSADQRDTVLKACKEMLPQAEKVAELEEAEFVRRLGEINKNGPKVLSVRDPNIEIIKRKDGKVTVSAKMKVEGPLSGTPSNVKN